MKLSKRYFKDQLGYLLNTSRWRPSHPEFPWLTDKNILSLFRVFNEEKENSTHKSTQKVDEYCWFLYLWTLIYFYYKVNSFISRGLSAVLWWTEWCLRDCLLAFVGAEFAAGPLFFFLGYGFQRDTHIHHSHLFKWGQSDRKYTSVPCTPTRLHLAFEHHTKSYVRTATGSMTTTCIAAWIANLIAIHL